MRTSIFRACDKDQIEIIKYIWEYFYNEGKEPSPDLNLFSKDERTGENTAMIAAKSGYSQITKYSAEKCKDNLLHKYEELLLILEDKHITAHIEEKLIEMERRLAGLGED